MFGHGKGTDFEAIIKIVALVLIIAGIVSAMGFLINSSGGTGVSNPPVEDKIVDSNSAGNEAGTGVNNSESGAKIYTIKMEATTITSSSGAVITVPERVYKSTISVKEFDCWEEHEKEYYSTKSERILIYRLREPSRVFAIVEKKSLEDLFLEVNGVTLSNFRMVNQPTSQGNIHSLYVDVDNILAKKFNVHVCSASKLPFKLENALHTDQTPTVIRGTSKEVLLEYGIKNWDKSKFILLDIKFIR